MNKKIILTIAFGIATLLSYAQHTLLYTNPDKLFHDGKDLYEQRKYGASYRSFEEYVKQAKPTDAGMLLQAEYYMASNAYELRQADAKKQLETHLELHPYTPYYDRVKYLLGMLEYEKKRYAQALEHFRVVDDTHLNDKEQIDFLFCRGYANLETGNYTKARDIFNTLKAMNTTNHPKALYYTGYTEYKLGNYDAALPDLLLIENHPDFADAAPYYITQIYYSKGNYDEVDKRADELLRMYPNNVNNAEIYRIAGERAFAKNNYAKAASNLINYEKTIGEDKMLRNDKYYLGIALLKTGRAEESIKYLADATSEADELSESAYLQLGNAYVKTGNKTNARLVYESALRTKFNPQVREEALFNYALTTYETTTVFGESVKAFEQFLDEFPNSKQTDKAYDYLATVYLTSKNYTEAYKSISKIKNLTPKLRDTKQYIEYQLGTESFTNGNHYKAIEYFTKAVQSSPQGKYLADVYYWRSESNYRLKNYSDAVSDLSKFFSQPKVASNVNYVQSLYSMGYAYFSQKKYNDALNWFLKYLGAEKNKKSSTYSDALNRIGDGYFNQRNFTLATEYYDKAAEISPSSGDYGLFQSAYTAGLQKNYALKIEKLNQLLEKFPRSDYNDDALYEMARAYLMTQNDDKTVETYRKLITEYPNSTLAPRAVLETGMVYYNNKENDKAIAEFKNVVSTYPASEEANTALESLEAIYVEKGDADSYITYIKSLGIEINKASLAHQDSITFAIAEKQYMEDAFSKALPNLKAYIEKFCPNGRFCTIAQHYLADIYYRNKDKENALIAYDTILNTSGSPYMEQAALRAAEISFDQKNYSAAMNYFKKLDTYAQTAENKNIARLGVLRTSYSLNSDTQTISIAAEILSDNKSTEAMRTEALYNRAKAYSRQNKLNETLKDLRQIKIDTRTAIGAEAKYLIAETYYKLNKLNDAEAEVLDFAKKNSPFQYWLARSFVVLADVYVQKGNSFQAKQYLLSLQKNYTVKDDVQSMITTRLNAIAEQEKVK
ncbi:MAG: tetratricopeptide repeat protein [Paludibacteraceae bacterium]